MLPIAVATRSETFSAAARLLGLRFRIPSGAWMSVSCECGVLSGRGICDRQHEVMYFNCDGGRLKHVACSARYNTFVGYTFAYH